MRLFVNASSAEEYPISYIRWDEADTDTIQVLIKRTDRSLGISSLWYNDELKVQDPSKPRFLEIIK